MEENCGELEADQKRKSLQFTVQVEGGQPIEVKTGLGLEASNLSWSPDGKTIAFIATNSEAPELWLLENFLTGIDNKK